MCLYVGLGYRHTGKVSDNAVVAGFCSRCGVMNGLVNPQTSSLAIDGWADPRPSGLATDGLANPRPSGILAEAFICCWMGIAVVEVSCTLPSVLTGTLCVVRSAFSCAAPSRAAPG
jgi:hypothetical protein